MFVMNAVWCVGQSAEKNRYHTKNTLWMRVSMFLIFSFINEKRCTQFFYIFAFFMFQLSSIYTSFKKIAIEQST